MAKRCGIIFVPNMPLASISIASADASVMLFARCLVKSLDLCQRLTRDGERFRRSKLLALASPTKFDRSFRCLTYWARIRIARRGLFLFLRTTLLTNSIAGAHLRLCDR